MHLSETIRNRLAWVGGTLAACVVGILFVYWPIVSIGFAIVSSDSYDGKIMVAMLEHWHNVYQLKESPLTPIYFHPFTGTLAYNESNLISGAIYSIFRSFGADPFLAYELVNWTVRIVGCVGTIAFARKGLRLNMPYSLACGFLVLIVTNLALRMSHAQLLFASLVPVGLLLFTATFERMREATEGRSLRPAILSALALVGLVYAWAMTAFYSFYVLDDRNSMGLPSAARPNSRWQTDWSLPWLSRFAPISTRTP